MAVSFVPYSSDSFIAGWLIIATTEFGESREVEESSSRSVSYYSDVSSAALRTSDLITLNKCMKKSELNLCIV